MSRDVIVPAAIVVYPDPRKPGHIEIVQQHTAPPQLVALMVAVLRWASLLGIMGDVMRALAEGGPTETTTDYGSAPDPGTPPDDIPPHLRRSPPR
jgi:hypothetical protein